MSTKEITVPSDISIANVPVLLEKIDAEINALQGNLEVNDSIMGRNLINFNTTLKGVKNLTILTKIFSQILARQDYYHKSRKLLLAKCEVDVPSFKYEGFTYAEWEKAICVRAIQIQNQNKLKKLKTAKEKLSSYLSEKDKFQRDMADIFELMTEKSE
jgi:hypothetical protein